jgi:hypothetical protein
MGGMSKPESISLRVSTEVKKAVERGARSQQQTVASFVEQVLVHGLVGMGYLREVANPQLSETTSDHC